LPAGHVTQDSVQPLARSAKLSAPSPAPAATAFARLPGQAIPFEGLWRGETNDCLGRSVNIAVHKV